MPISGTSTDYTGRTKDLHIFQGVDPSRSVQVTPSFGKISNYCTGIQKLVQRYAICLMTELGSQANYPDFGTSLISTLMNSHRPRNKADVFPVFNKANLKVLDRFRAYQRAHTDLPVDEQLSTALLKDVTSDLYSVGLTIALYPLTADPVTFILPLPKSS
jgi:hypothetical protein